jgi:hypothetical protein
MKFTTVLDNRTAEISAAIKGLGGIYLESYGGGPRGFGVLNLVTSNIAEALEKAKMVMTVIHPRRMHISPQPVRLI